MSNALKTRIETLAADAIKLAMASGLTWDEAVAAFGVASKALATKASTQGDGNKEGCELHALKRFQQGLAQDVEILSNMLQ